MKEWRKNKKDNVHYDTKAQYLLVSPPDITAHRGGTIVIAEKQTAFMWSLVGKSKRNL